MTVSGVLAQAYDDESSASNVKGMYLFQFQIKDDIKAARIEAARRT
jgi:hypothetical protein